MNTWYIPYHPGKLEALGYDRGGKVVKRFKVETTGEPYALQLVPYRNALKNDGWDAMPVTVQVVDCNGRVVPTAKVPVSFDISDNAAIIGLGNGNPNSHEPEKGNRQSVFNGLAQVIIQSKEGGSREIVITAASPNIKPAAATISLEPATVPPFVTVPDEK